MVGNQKQRSYFHDYRAPGRYMITLMKHPEIPPFSEIAIKEAGHQLSPQNVYTRWSAVGKVIAYQLYNIGSYFPELVVEQYAVMPDHVHFLLHVNNYLPDSLGKYIARLKVNINNASGIPNVFEQRYNDRIVSPSRSLDVIYKYIRQNPYRLAVRQAVPNFFTRRNDLSINDVPCSAYGNIQLLDNPFIDWVVVHRADSEATYKHNKYHWLDTVANGGVLVSPFISGLEKEIRREAEELNGRLILITERPFGEREKPMGKDFELCTQGRLLIIAPTSPLPFGRRACLKMNALAKDIASRNFVWKPPF